jgi:hypothetical protein
MQNSRSGCQVGNGSAGRSWISAGSPRSGFSARMVLAPRPRCALKDSDCSPPCVGRSVPDHFGRLAVPDVLARTCDAEHIRLEPGRYLLQGFVQRLSSVLLGIGLDATLARVANGQRAAG